MATDVRRSVSVVCCESVFDHLEYEVGTFRRHFVGGALGGDQRSVGCVLDERRGGVAPALRVFGGAGERGLLRQQDRCRDRVRPRNLVECLVRCGEALRGRDELAVRRLLGILLRGVDVRLGRGYETGDLLVREELRKVGVDQDRPVSRVGFPLLVPRARPRC
ncbi:hypothetical protein [Streptomyces sp. NBC_00687]|uniref:hypothetical protein n=1 Tax=Streptomyces sp. NBC_00687 TaxID=2975807 RepID=UPI00224F0809|nr:hypothetical protein [Streptomyces sp. NBC_00687]MCX4918779.1 hypothetical protein [Streptomyces sp. NBC_00687]